MPQIKLRKKALTRLAVFCLGTSALGILPAFAADPLYGLNIPIAGALTFGQINVTSGAFTSISQLPGGLVLPLEVNASNPISGEYYFGANSSGVPNTLAVNGSSGAYRFLNTGLTILGFDVSKNLLVASNLDSSGNHIVTVDPVTLAQTQLSAVYAPASQIFVSAGTAVNSIGREIYITTPTSLLVTNLDTGALIRSVNLSQNTSGTLAWDPVSGILYDFAVPTVGDFRLASINTVTGQVSTVSVSNVLSGGIANQGRSLSVIDGVVYVQSLGSTYDVIDLATGALKGTFSSSATSIFPQDQVVIGGTSNTIFPFNVQNGNASIIKVGAGTTVLTGANSNMAGTIISAGTLQLGNGGTTGTITGNVVNNGAFVIDRSNAYTFSGAIGGTGSVSIMGGGTVTFAAANTYTGGTIISGGTLAVSADSNLGAVNSGIALNGGTLQFLDSFNMDGARTIVLNAAGGTIDTNTFSTSIGDNINNAGSTTISGTGSLTKKGDGLLLLTGTQTYTGGTILDGGNIQVVAGSLASTGGVAINGGIFDFVASNSISTQVVGTLSGAGGTLALSSVALTTNSQNNSIFAGGITGNGSLIKAGTGTLILTGANTYTGITTVSAGRLSITGSIASSAVTVQSGAALGGTGTVGVTTVASGGTLAPGNSIGTLTVNGNLTLASGSTYSVEVSPSAADRTMVSGTASLNGTVATTVASGTYAFGQRFTLLTATGGVNGTFASLTGIPASLKGQLSYDASNAYLTLSPNTLAPLLSNATANQGKVIAAIDAAVTAGNVPSGGFVTLYGLSGSALSGALDQISGQIGPNTINAVGQGTLSFLAMTAQGGSNSGNFAPGSAYGAADAPHRAQLGAGETRVWASAYGGHVGLSADGASGAASLSSSNVGLIGGADMAWDDGLLAGVTVGLGQQHFSSGNGTGSSDDIMIGVYARKNAGPLYVTAAFGYGAHHIETLRVVTVSGTDVLQGKQEAEDFGGRVEAGWHMALDDRYALTPYFAVAAENFDSPAYAEAALSGASIFALSFASHSSALGRSELGSTLSRDYEIENGVLAADLRLAWAHELDDQPFTQASFQGLPGASFLVSGVRPAGNTALLGAGVQVQNRSGLFFGVKGEAQLGAGTTMVEGMGHLGWRW